MTLTPFSIYKIFGQSMLPTLKPGDKVVTLNWLTAPKVGDIVAAKINSREILKRIHLIKNDEVFLKGDNDLSSTDSRSFGWIKKSQLKGKVIYILKAQH